MLLQAFFGGDVCRVKCRDRNSVRVVCFTPNMFTYGTHTTYTWLELLFYLSKQISLHSHAGNGDLKYKWASGHKRTKLHSELRQLPFELAVRHAVRQSPLHQVFEEVRAYF